MENPFNVVASIDQIYILSPNFNKI